MSFTKILYRNTRNIKNRIKFKMTQYDAQHINKNGLGLALLGMGCPSDSDARAWSLAST